MKGFIILGLGASSILSAQTDSTQIKEIQEVSFTKRLPVSKEIINVQKDLGAKNLGQDLPILLKNQMSVVQLPMLETEWVTLVSELEEALEQVLM